jgi:hypothetical protein
MGFEVDRVMFALGRRRAFAEIVGTLPTHGRPDRPRREPSAAVRAHVPQDGVDTFPAERAFKGADHRVDARRRQIGIAVLAVRAEFEGHTSIVAHRPASGLPLVRLRADFQLHAVGVAEEQRPLGAELLDLTDLRAGGTRRSLIRSNTALDSTANA